MGLIKNFLSALLMVFVITYSTHAQGKIAITIDDLPIAAGARKYPIEIQKQIMDKLIGSLKKVNAPVIGFVNENQLYSNEKVNEAKIDLLKSWLAAGFDLGNHTYSHKSANVIPVEEYENDILSGEIISKPLVKNFGNELKFFRHPFL